MLRLQRDLKHIGRCLQYLLCRELHLRTGEYHDSARFTELLSIGGLIFIAFNHLRAGDCRVFIVLLAGDCRMLGVAITAILISGCVHVYRANR